ncbi:potassium transporter TrkG, partial [uncultured Muribaculum sp.]
SIRRANAIVTLSLLALFVYTTALLLLEPGLPPKAVIFETVSALFTVGSSLGITDQLSDISKITLCSAMFLGRVGIISLLIGITGNQTNPPIDFPTDNVIIN